MPSCSAKIASLIIGHEDPVDGEARRILDVDRGLADAPDEIRGARLRRVARQQPADQLDQRHDRHRIEEMHADEALRTRRCAAASAVIEIDEVFVASTACGAMISSACCMMRRLISRFSVAASITRSDAREVRVLGRAANARPARQPRPARLSLLLLHQPIEARADGCASRDRPPRRETSTITTCKSRRRRSPGRCRYPWCPRRSTPIVEIS